MSKRIISLVLTFALIVACCPVLTHAAEETACTLEVSSVYAAPGATIEVNLNIKDNPGILGATLTVSWDDGLTLVDSKNGEAFSELSMVKPSRLQSGCKFVWYGTETEVIDGSILKLYFTVPENAEDSDVYGIRVNYEKSDIADTNGGSGNITLNIKDGTIRIITYIPGDVNSDKRINPSDLVDLAKYISDGCVTDPEGYNVTINESAADVNDDGKINPLDLVNMAKYISDGCVTDPDGYNITLKPSTPKCKHTMESIAYKAATCTEDGNVSYYHCTTCGKYYNDSNGTTEIALANTVLPKTGHTAVTDPYVAPTYTSVGWTEGSHCSTCGETLKAQEEIPMLKKNIVNVIYHLEGREQDQYLINYLKDKDMATINTNPSQFDTTIQEHSLKGIGSVIPGYIFTGWVDEYGDPFRTIEKGQTGSVEIYATWTREEYTVKYESTMVPVTDPNYKAYKAGQGLEALPNLKMDKYTFIGWSDKNGKLWDSIPAGTVGNITLYANWVSERNLANPVDTLGDPIIVEDPEKGMIFFTYEIGTITHVPLFTTLHMDVVNGLVTSTRIENQTVISSEDARTVAEMVSNQTTNSTSWSLQEHWDETTEVNRTEHEQTEESRRQTEEFARSHTGNYNIGVSYGKALNANITDSGAYKLTANRAHSATITEERGNSIDLSVDAKYSKGKTSGLSLGIPIKALELGISAGKSSNFEIGGGAEYNQQKKNTASGTASVDMGAEFSGEASKSLTGEKSWNADIGYSSSNTNKYAQEVSVEISKLISQEYGYGESYNRGGENSQTRGQEWTDEKSHEFSSTLTYFNSAIEVKTKEFQSTGNTIGDYRMVISGTVHVFAVVRYDMGTNSYSVYTLNMLDDETKEYLDYSYDGSFNDYETSFIPFEIPVFVNHYVNNRMAETEGLVFDTERGIYSKYNVAENSKATIISVPSYYSEDNGDGTYDTYKVTGIGSEVFQNNTDIVGVILGHHITEIPNDAFAGCTSLKYVVCPGVTKIGDRAFSGCTSLDKFTISEHITSVGEDAFTGVPEIAATAATAEIAENIAASGAQKITLDISKIPVTQREDVSLSVGKIDTFELQGKKQEYKNLSVKSDANTTVINGVKVNGAVKIPLILSSEFVRLENETDIASSGCAMLLKADTTNVKVDGTIYMTSGNNTTVVSRTMTIEPKYTNRVGKLALSGKVLVWGSVTGESNMTCAGIEYIDQNTYEKYEDGVFTLTFDANEGTVYETNRTVFYGQPYGDLPVPSRAGWVFTGWFTEKTGGTQIKADDIVHITADQTLYAHWSAMAYTATWSGGEGYTITVNRTESPHAGAATGELKSGAEVFYGDKLSVAYTANTGYSISSQGSTSITVTGNVTSSHISASASPNKYTYNIVYRSSNGTTLGTATAGYLYGTTNTITPPGFAGYNTPGAQTVKWDSTSAKTITFTYEPSGVATSQSVTSGSWWKKSNYTYINYATSVEYQNRKANSVEIRIVWTNSFTATDGRYGYAQYFNGSCGGVGTGDIQICTASTWASTFSGTKTQTVSSGWITVPVGTTNQTTLTVSGSWWDQNSKSGSWSGTITIPAY